MSYILEAIKKADQKRKLGSVPDVHTVHDGPPPAGKVLVWPYVLAAGLFINAGLIALWLHPWAPVEVKTTAVMNNSRAVLPAAKGQGREKTGKPLAKPPVERVAKSGHPAEQPVAKAPQVPAAPETAKQGGATAPPAVRGKVLVKDDKQPLPAGGQVTEAEDNTRQGPVQNRALAPEQPAQIPPVGPAPEDTKVVERIGGQPLPDTDQAKLALARDKQREAEGRELAKIPFLHQLPEEFRKDLPQIHISFLSYSYVSAKRLVSINGRILREGQELASGLRLEKITPVGVVLMHKSRQFKVELSTSSLKG